MVIPFILGWALITWAANVGMMVAGRFIIGFSGGTFCVAAPIYTAEICESEIRGALGSYFSLMLAGGILYVYIIGSFINLYILTIMCLLVPIIFAVTFFFMPESPMFLISKGKTEQAAKSLQKLRGKHYNIEGELRAMQQNRALEQENKLPCRKAFSTKAAIKAITISMFLMLFMQFCGINAVVFYSSSIFEEGGLISADTAGIIIAVVQVIFVLVSIVIVDKLGRRILLIISAVSMALSCLGMGTYTIFSKNPDNHDMILKLSWVPLVTLCVYMAAFSTGFGPIPWMMIGELFPSAIKGIAGAISTTFCWIVAFFVTQSFGMISDQLGKDWPFWIYGTACVIAAIFVYFCVPETKAKTLSQIQLMLGRSNN